MHTNECFGPPLPLPPFCVPGTVVDTSLGDEGVMKVRDGGHIPRAAGRGTCEKSASVVDKVGYYHFDDLQGKNDSRG